MNYDELLIFISKRKKRRLQANYQPLVIKNLVQNNGKLKKQKLLEIIQKSNPELTDEKAKGIEVFTVLENLNILSRNADNLELTLSRINSEQEIELIQHCNDWIENVYSVFFYILLAIAKFFGSGDFKDHNLERLADYYTNIFIIYYKSGNITADNSGIELLDMFLTYQVKINTSLIELNLNSETLDEIINYLSDSIRNNLNIDEKPIL